MQDHTPTFPKNITEYAPWVAEYGLTAPYGECQCGCGRKTAIKKSTGRKGFLRKGHPTRFLPGHWQQGNDPVAKFWKYCIPGAPDECWEWQGNIGTNGYGRFRCAGTTYATHRLSYEIHNGPVPDGLNILHKCDNPACCNPHHLFAGTDLDNMRDKAQKLRAPRGSENKKSKLDEVKVHRIRELASSGTAPLEIAKEFGVSRRNIYEILNGRTWRHVA